MAELKPMWDFTFFNFCYVTAYHWPVSYNQINWKIAFLHFLTYLIVQKERERERTDTIKRRTGEKSCRKRNREKRETFLQKTFAMREFFFGGGNNFCRRYKTGVDFSIVKLNDCPHFLQLFYSFLWWKSWAWANDKNG